MKSVLISALPLLAAGHGKFFADNYEINPFIGTYGFPDCVAAHPEQLPFMTPEEASMNLVCKANNVEGATTIATIGDSITAGVCSSGDGHTYPDQLQVLLDTNNGEGKFAVTNLGACGSTMQKGADSPYWDRPQYDALTSQEWDIVIIMLGTNDAKDTSSGGPDNWQHDCGGAINTTTDGCIFASDYNDMIALVKTLGNPKIYLQVPPPLMQEGSIGANQTVINTVYPQLVPLIAEDNKGDIEGIIDVYGAMGGDKDNWAAMFPEKCELNSEWDDCEFWCNEQSCDQCHPDDDGYVAMAAAVYKGLGL